MRLAFFGDIVGRSGRDGLAEHLPHLRRQLRLEFVVVNAENAAGGFGITESTARELFAAGADCLTLGNHSWDQREALTYIVREPRLIRPLNYPAASQAPGRGAQLFDAAGGHRVLVINLLGRVHMEPLLDDPFSAVDRELDACPLGQAADAIIVDMHAEATSEKMAMGHFCDGRASLVIGTHSHVPTADAQILNGGTAYQSDAGACADYDSVIGNQKEEPLRRFTTRISGGRFQPAEGPASVCGVYVETDAATGLALRIEPIRLGGRLSQTVPDVAVAERLRAAPAP
jgi:2',3'-cyclic-nucleotide 2'-phosphodiesterase